MKPKSKKMYCSNFVEDVANKIIDKMKCPCSIKNYTYYNKKIRLLYSYACDECNSDYDLLIIEELGTDMLISCLHDNDFPKFVEFLEYIELIDGDKILSHINCYNFDSGFYCHKVFHGKPWKDVRFVTCRTREDCGQRNCEEITFKEWFYKYFDLKN